ncbi:hypothetical protein E1B28_001424 [Marasmius oreades]|uniref:Protein FAM32A n=1 Tax=Marasmius oreades TaxID=181124 RepID=A0A9P7V3D0_9AGAR|nr:uncharacterized protein E1B28_001424 [Marasmius oreades]KAG7099594.1 hypothetical protein E1B28_001424 [Marasmius oreades]
MSDYDIRPAGSLKLKGSATDGGVVKKKRKKSKIKEDSAEPERESKRVKESLSNEHVDSTATPPGSGRNSPAASSSKSKKTDAEKRFEEVQKRRLQQRVAKMAHKTHKDRVAELNAHLESLSEHHDIPKVGPG